MSGTTNRCAYCGLPVVDNAAADAVADAARLAARPAARPAARRYCCLGCRIADAVTHGAAATEVERSLATRLGFAVFLSMNVMVLSMFLWSRDGNLTPQPAAELLYQLARLGCLILTTLVAVLLGEPMLTDAFEALRARRLSSAVLLLAGITAAYVYSVISMLRGGNDVYFEVTCVVLVVTTLGRCLEAVGRQRSTILLRSLEELLPATARPLQHDGACASLVPTSQLQPGDTIVVLPGERIPVDGRIVRYSAAVDEQAVTGESLPVTRGVGDRVLAGGVSTDGELWVEAESRADAGFLRQTIDAVIRGALLRTRYQRLADRVTAWCFPAITLVAAVTFAVHCLGQGVEAAGLAAIAVLVIACPCALGLATPMALWAALGRCARDGIVIRDGEALLQLAHASRFCFDKTGTLTTGHAEVRDAQMLGETDWHLAYRVAAHLAAGSMHPLSQAIVRFVQSTEPLPDAGRTIEPGKGIQAWIGELGVNACLGSPRWFQELGWRTPAAATIGSDSGSQVWLGWDRQIRAVFDLTQELRPVAAVVRNLAIRMPVAVLSGDRPEYAKRQLAGLPVEIHAGLLPGEKVERIEGWVGAGQSVVMVGDGINDGPALARATVGIALGCGTDLSRASARICLLANDLSLLPGLIQFAQRVDRTIRWNLVWAFVYNLIGIGLAALGIVNPILAALIMVISSLLVVSNSLRLTRGDGEADQPAPHSAVPEWRATVNSTGVACPN